MSAEASARTVMERCATLGGYSEEAGRLTRRYGTPPLRQAMDAVAGWMRAAGMEVRRDAVGNLIGRYAAAATGARTLLLGSHLDTVRDAGRYDGPLGVMTVLACVERLGARGVRLPYALEVVAFADEEGLRFHTGYLGSSVFAGAFDSAWLALTDDEGVTLERAVREFGGDPERLTAGARARADLLGYLEVHIEQGPVLEARGLPVGVVSAIQGQSRFALRFVGAAGHAGTVPMGLRHDALCAASELVLAAEALARDRPGLVATVGQLCVEPGASNVIPGAVALTLDLRHPDDDVRVAACAELEERARAIGAARGVATGWERAGEQRAVPCSPGLSALLERAVAAVDLPVIALPSGAGHDAAVVAGLTEVAMLFVRCAGGISHNPAESVAPADVAAAIAVVDRFLELLAAREGGGA
jgi:allantoate deiminase